MSQSKTHLMQRTFYQPRAFELRSIPLTHLLGSSRSDLLLLQIVSQMTFHLALCGHCIKQRSGKRVCGSGWQWGGLLASADRVLVERFSVSVMA